MVQNRSWSVAAMTCAVPFASKMTRVGRSSPARRSVSSRGSPASAAAVHTPVPGLNAGPSGGSGPAPFAPA
ncbi:MAG: hypothetical protein M3Y74_03860 [Chloroflexota bacterium]|nr:hypothetical protein [Chloroflexota bacterium]